MIMSETAISRLRTIISFTIAILTLFSGLLGWQTGNISDEAAGAYARAQRAELNQQKIKSTNTLKGYEDYRAFLVYKNYFEQYKLVSLQLTKAKAAEAPDGKLITQLTAKRDELESLYLSSLRLFPNQFINRDGTYNLQEELGQLNAADARKLDTNPDTFLARGAHYDAQVSRMQIALILLAVALFFLAVISTLEDMKHPLLLGLTTAGYIAALAGVILGAWNWQPAPFDSQAASQPPAISAPASQAETGVMSNTFHIP
jgi:hypothetical protein